MVEHRFRRICDIEKSVIGFCYVYLPPTMSSCIRVFNVVLLDKRMNHGKAGGLIASWVIES